MNDKLPVNNTLTFEVFVVVDSYSKKVIKAFETMAEAEQQFGKNKNVCIEKMFMDVERVLHG